MNSMGTSSETSTPILSARSLFRSTSTSLIANNNNIPLPYQSHKISDPIAPVSSSDYIPTKTVSCENISSSIGDTKSSFPHAFLRSKPPRSGSASRPNVEIKAIEKSEQTVPEPKSSNDRGSLSDIRDALRQKLKAVSEENFPMTWWRKNQTSMKMRLHSNFPRSKHQERSSSTQSMNTDTIVYHSPLAPTDHLNSVPNYISRNTASQLKLPGNRSSLYISSTESGYESEGLRSQANLRRKFKKTESDADSGVSTGSHSETNSDSGSFTSNDSSFDHNSKNDKSNNKANGINQRDFRNKFKTSKETSTDETKFCKCPLDMDETSQLNLTDEEKLVPALSEDIHPILPEPANITSLRHKFLVSQLNRRSAGKCSSPSPSNQSIEEHSIGNLTNHYWTPNGVTRSGTFRRDGSGEVMHSDASYSRPPLSLPSLSLPLNNNNAAAARVTPPRTFKMMRLTKDTSGELGIYITAKRNSQGTTTGYVIAHIEKGGLTDR